MATGNKIALGSIVDIRGDGTWSPMADAIINTLITPFVNVDWKEFDLSLANRDATDDAIVPEIANALKQFRTGVKGPTITPTAAQAAQLGLKQVYPSPNGAIRTAINGVAITRAAIYVEGLTALPKDVVMLRQPIGGIYGAPNGKIPEAGTLVLTFTNAAGETTQLANVKVQPGAFSLETADAKKIEAYARYAFDFALRTGKKEVVLGHKDTIQKAYDGELVAAFKRVFDEQPADGSTSFAQRFAENQIAFKPMLIDAAAELLCSEKLKPDTLLVLKNYDGDVQSDNLAGLAKSLALVTSELESEGGAIVMADPPHGTADVFNKLWAEEGILMANPTSYIFAYARAIEHRGEVEGKPEAVHFAKALKQSTVAVIEQGLQQGFVTADVALLKAGLGKQTITAQDFMARIADRLMSELRPQANYAYDAAVAATLEGGPAD